MTDYDLLKRAALANGLTILDWISTEDGGVRCLVTLERGHWNPLTNDTDALQLAVNLNVHIAINDYMIVSSLDPETSYSQSRKPDPYGALRRAIVCIVAGMTDDD